MAKSLEIISNPEYEPKLTSAIKQGLSYGHIGPENAQRMLLNLPSLSQDITDSLKAIDQTDKQSEEIVLPSLRQINDFAVNDSIVFKQEAPDSTWQHVKVHELLPDNDTQYLMSQVSALKVYIPVNYLYLWGDADFAKLEELRDYKKPYVSWARFCANFEIASNNISKQDAKAFFRYFADRNLNKKLN